MRTHHVLSARGLGALLYACLTARWPIGDDGHGLALAPRIGDRRAEAGGR